MSHLFWGYAIKQKRCVTIDPVHSVENSKVRIGIADAETTLLGTVDLSISETLDLIAHLQSIVKTLQKPNR